MILNLICFGKMDGNGYADLEKYYLEKLRRFCEIKVIALKEEVTPDTVKNMRNNEEMLKKYVAMNGVKILLDFNGRQYSSEDFATKLSSLNITMNQTINLFIGPSDGFSQEFRAQFNDKISFGKATMTHQLIRVVLLEQIYRAFKIINHEKYHK